MLGFGAFGGYAGILALMAMRHQWILDGKGHPVVADFLALFTAGRMALQGRALAAYNPILHHAAEEAIVRQGFSGALAWPYPPHFFFVTATIALLPYAVSFLVWSFGTMALYAAITGAIARERQAVLLALAPPFVLGGLIAGQNGFFAAALLGGALLAIERRPIFAGILIGVLTFKPQFGILIPFALAADGQWRSFAAAAVSAVLLILLAAGVFGFETVPAFLSDLPATTANLLVHGAVGWNKVQSFYGASRWLGAPDTIAMVLQAVASLVCIAFVVLLWRSPAPYALKAAGLAVSVLLATPYVFVYDFPFVAIALAFVYRARPFDRVEIAASALALVPLAAFTASPTPVALLTPVIVMAMIVRRVCPVSLAARAGSRLAPSL